MKRWMIPIALLAICVLVGNLVMPISLADQNRIEIEGRLNMNPDSGFPINVDEYKIGELQKGDKIKVVISDIRGDGNIKTTLTNTSVKSQRERLNSLVSCFWLGRGTETRGTCGCPGCLPCLCLSTVLLRHSRSSDIEKTTFTSAGEKTFTVPEDGVYYINMNAKNLKGNVIYSGHIEIIKTEK